MLNHVGPECLSYSSVIDESLVNNSFSIMELTIALSLMCYRDERGCNEVLLLTNTYILLKNNSLGDSGCKTRLKSGPG